MLKKILVALLLVCSLLGVLSAIIFQFPPHPESIADEFSLQNMTIINPLIEKTKAPTLSVHGGLLSLKDDNLSNNHIAKYDDMFVLPGLVNMHSHSPGNNALKLGPMFSLAAMMHGVTTWRDAIDADGTGVPALRKQQAEGNWPTPDIVSCAVINKGPSRWPNSNIIESKSELPSLIKTLKHKGNDCIKSYESLTKEMIDQVKHEAAKYDMQVIGHVPEGITIEEAWLPDTQHFFGVQQEHQYGVVDRNGNWLSVDTSRIQEVANIISERNMINTPTLVTLQQLQEYRNYALAQTREEYRLIPSFYTNTVWHPEKGLPVYRNLKPNVLSRAQDALSKKLLLLKKLNDLNATLNIGTDTQQPFVVPGISMWQEMRLFQQAGINAEEIWAHATWKSREQLPGNKRELLKEGATATFLIFSEDPTLSLGALDSLKAVVIKGQLYEIETLKASMKELSDHYESWPMRSISEFFAGRALDKIAKKFIH